MVLHVRAHPTFRRQGADLLVELRISFPKAALGGKAQVKVIEDEVVEVTVATGTQSGTVLRIKGKGLTKLGSVYKGDLVVTLIVETPKKLSPKERDLMKQLAEAMGEGVDDKGILGRVRDVLR